MPDPTSLGATRRLVPIGPIGHTGEMLLTRPVLDGISAGRIDLAFRRWRKPTVKAGGRLRTVIGELAIHSVETVDPALIDDEQAHRAGYGSADALRAELFRVRPPSARGRTAKPTEDSRVYRVSMSYVGDDPRHALRSTVPSDGELAGIAARLASMDGRSNAGAWTQRVLTLVETWPARRAPELAEMEGRETVAFKTDVRKLKELGLTESLPVGYRLSPRGRAVLATLRGLPGP